MILSDIHPSEDRLLVLPLPDDEMTKAGVWIPAKSERGSLQRGKVLAKGPGKLNINGLRVAPAFEIGQTVIYPRGHGIEFQPVEGETTVVVLIGEGSVLASVTEPVVES